MIERVNLYMAICDRCKERFYTIAERDALMEKLCEKQWRIYDDRGCICVACLEKRSGIPNKKVA